MRRLRRTDGPGRGTLIGGAALALALILVFVRLIAPDLLLRAARPVFGAGDALAGSSTGFFSSFADARALAAKNAGLAQENAVLALENRTLEEKVASLTKLIGTTTPEGDGILAGVVARPPLAPYDTLVLAAGTEVGVRASMEAFGEGGVPLGIVSGTTAHFSRIQLFSAPGVATDAWVGPSHVPLTLQGKGAGAFAASAPQTAGIAVGDIVYLAGPGAVPVGKVAHIAGTPSDPIAALSIASLTNPFSITWVALRDVGPTEWASSTGALPL